jgi:hypothetical protein
MAVINYVLYLASVFFTVGQLQPSLIFAGNAGAPYFKGRHLALPAYIRQGWT